MNQLINIYFDCKYFFNTHPRNNKLIKYWLLNLYLLLQQELPLHFNLWRHTIHSGSFINIALLLVKLFALNWQVMAKWNIEKYVDCQKFYTLTITSSHVTFLPQRLLEFVFTKFDALIYSLAFFSTISYILDISFKYLKHVLFRLPWK